MQKKDKKLILFLTFFSFFILFFSNFINIVNATETVHLIYNGDVLATKILRMNNDTLVSLIHISSTNYIYISYSEDEGITWTTPVTTGSQNGYAVMFDACIDSTNIIYFSVWNGGIKITKISSSGTIDTEWKVISCTTSSFGDCDLAISNDNDLQLFFGYRGLDGNGRWIWYGYNKILNTWSSGVTVFDKNGYDIDVGDIIVDEDDRAWITWMSTNTGATEYQISLAYKDKSDSSFTTCSWYKGLGGTYDIVNNLKISVDLENYQLLITTNVKNTTSNKYEIMLYSLTYDGVLLDTYTVCQSSSYNSYLQDVQSNNEETISIMYYGTRIYHGNNLLMIKTFENGEISEEGYVTSGTDETTNSCLLYAHYPLFMRTYTGYGVIFRNDTDNQCYYTYTDDLLFIVDMEEEGEGITCSDLNDLEFMSMYDTTNCMEWNNFFQCFIRNGISGEMIGWSIYNETDVRTDRGTIMFIGETGYLYSFIDEIYGTGTFTLYVTTKTKYLLNGNDAKVTDCNTTYQFCVEEGEEKDYYILPEFKSYSEFEKLSIFIKAPEGETVYFHIASNGITRYNYSTPIIGTGNFTKLTEVWTCKMYTSADTENFELVLYNSTWGLPPYITGNWFTVNRLSTDYIITIDDTTPAVNQIINIKLVQNLNKGYDHLQMRIYKNGTTDFEYQNIQNEQHEFTWKYQCKAIGTYYVILIGYFPWWSPYLNEEVDGHKYYFICTTSGTGDGDWSLPKLEGTWEGTLIGLSIILGFCLAPLGIAVGTSTDLRDIPTIVYILFASFGLAVAVVLNTIPIWVPFFIIVILIIIGFIMWLRTNITESD